VNRQSAGVLMLVLWLAVGCGLLAENAPKVTAPEDVKRITFEIVARNNRCEPTVLAADREGRSLLINFKVNSVGKQHWFIIPELHVRKTVPAGTEVTIPVVAEWSGIFEYGCTGLRWLGPSDSKGKLAIK
jgi:cupredoxin-like protein